jgi:type I restriction enzyme S subunit
MSQWPKVRLSDCLQLTNEIVTVQRDQEYPNFGIYSFGLGLFRKRPISGLASSALTLRRVRRRQFIYSRLFAFEGAYGIVGNEFDGCFVSNEYPTFDCDETRILPQYLVAYFSMPRVWEAVAKGSKGLGVRRQRVPPDAILEETFTRVM